MPSLNRLVLLCLATLGLILCGANIVVTLQRTTIPYGLDGRVTLLRVLPEKHSGIDDVLLVALDHSPPFQIEQALFSQLAIDDHIHKAAWSRSVTINDARSTIPWSADFVGMARIIPILLVGLTLLTYASTRSIT